MLHILKNKNKLYVSSSNNSTINVSKNLYIYFLDRSITIYKFYYIRFTNFDFIITHNISKLKFVNCEFIDEVDIVFSNINRLSLNFCNENLTSKFLLMIEKIRILKIRNCEINDNIVLPENYVVKKFNKIYSLEKLNNSGFFKLVNSNINNFSEINLSNKFLKFFFEKVKMNCADFYNDNIPNVINHIYFRNCDIKFFSFKSRCDIIKVTFDNCEENTISSFINNYGSIFNGFMGFQIRKMTIKNCKITENLSFKLQSQFEDKVYVYNCLIIQDSFFEFLKKGIYTNNRYFLTYNPSS